MKTHSQRAYECLKQAYPSCGIDFRTGYKVAVEIMQGYSDAQLGDKEIRYSFDDNSTCTECDRTDCICPERQSDGSWVALPKDPVDLVRKELEGMGATNINIAVDIHRGH